MSDDTGDLTEIRRRAEANIKNKTHKPPVQGARDIQNLVHELETHQVELEMQNDELRHARTDLEESRERYTDLFDLAPLGYFILDRSGIIREVNFTGAQLIGREKRAILNIPFSSFVQPDDFECFFQHLKEVFERQVRKVCELRLLRQGKVFFAQIQTIVEECREGEPAACRMAMVDISERKQVEDALCESDEILKDFIRKSRDGIVIVDERGLVLEWNPAQVEITGIHRHKALGQRFWDVLYRLTPSERLVPAYLGEAREKVLKGLNEGLSFQRNIESEIQRTDGTRRMIQSLLFAIRHGEGILACGICRDVTERIKAEEKLTHQRQLLETIVRHLPAAVCVIRGLDMRIQLVNPAYQAIAPGKEMLGKTLDELWPESRQSFTDLCRRVLVSGEPYHAVEDRHMIRRSPDGAPEPAYFNWSLYRVRLPGDEGWAILNTAWEITELKRADAARCDSEERYRRVVENTTAIILRIDLDGVIRFANGRALQFFGYTEEELIGKHAVGTIVPERETTGRDLAGMVQQIAAHPDHFHTNANENLCKNGERVWMEWTNSGVYDAEGNLKEFLAVGIDATERKRAEEALRASEARYRTLHETLRDAFAQVTLDGQIIEFNDQYCQMLGYTPEEIRGLTYQDLTPEHWHAMEEEIVSKQIIARGYSDVYEKEYRRKDGTIIPVELRTVLSRDESGQPAAMWGIVRDITGRKQAEQALRQANEQLLGADRRKDEFLAMLAHELRNPLAPVRNALELLKLTGPRHAGLDRQRTVIERQINHMARLLDDLLDVSRITRGKIELRRQRLRLSEVLGQAVEAITPQVAARGQTLAFTPPNEMLFVEADFDRLLQIVGNLLANAVKFTDPGGRIWLEARQERAGKHLAVIRVRDTGVGITPEVLPHIFELFVQADRSLAHVQGGLGIGLTMVKSLVEMHGGAVEAHSPGVNLGSEFIVRLPALNVKTARKPIENEDPRDAGSGPCRRVLIVDDVEDSAESLAELLVLWGHQARAVFSGAQALEAARDLKPDLVLLDIGMPGMDGFETAQRLRQQLADLPLRLIAMTGYGQEHDRERTEQGGFDDHLVKPVDLEHLKRILAETM